MNQHTNKLIHETSPYLLQHAHNPVEWFPWGEEALNKAKQENKPILVSIGYSACHWCHVMERESFEDEATAAVMNEHFVNIKIDREERPDLDHIYMDAVQAMTGSGGWPLNVFLTPDGRPFYGGTYFPPRKAFNRPSWTDVLTSISQAFKTNRDEIESQANNLTDHLLQANSFGLQKTAAEEIIAKERIDEAVENVMKQADKEWGGFGRAPKFPQTFTIQFLLRYYYTTSHSTSPTSSAPNLRSAQLPPEEGASEDSLKKKSFPDKESSSLSPGAGWGEVALQQALLSLDKMIEGGIYDQVGGGFARYSTDTEWLAPHFEKMLYDNALLVSVLSEAFQLTKKERYREVIEETIDFVQRELMHPQKGFYAALDADSEGEEGRFYVWNIEEVKQLLKEDAVIFCEYYDITPGGNWEHKNILRAKEPLEQFAQRKNIATETLHSLLQKGKEKLLTERNKRVRPGLDDKIILGWNALMNTALSKAFGATGKDEYKQLAIDNMRFLLKKLAAAADGGFHHTWKNEEAKYPAFLDDYAFLIQALIALQEITAEAEWLEKAGELAGFAIDHFSEADTGFFFYTKEGEKDIIVRKKEVYDGAVPSGNSVMAGNLYQLGLLLDRPEWKERAFEMVSSLGKAIIRYPSSFGIWIALLQEFAGSTNEIAVLGPGFRDVLKKLLAEYIPHRVLMGSEKPAGFPLFEGKKAGERANIWLCHNYACKQPVSSVEELITLINSGKAAN